MANVDMNLNKNKEVHEKAYMEKYIQTNYFHIYSRIKGTRIWGDRYRNIYSRIRNKHIQKIIK